MVPENLSTHLLKEMREMYELSCGAQIQSRGRITKSDAPKIAADVHVETSLNERRLEKIAKIKSVLMRLENGWAGHCSDCGKDIPAERLLAMPTTDLCIDCARAKEKFPTRVQ